MKTVIAEKPSVAREIAGILGHMKNGWLFYREGVSGYLGTWVSYRAGHA